MTRSTTIGLLAMSLIGMNADSAEIIDCAVCSVGVQSDFCTGFSSEIRILNCEAIVSAAGLASGFATETTIDFSSLSPSCLPDEPRAAYVDV